MEIIKRLNKVGNGHSQYYVLDVLRWALGALLFFKGVQFMMNTSYLVDIINPQSRDLLTIVLVHYIAFVHLAGGIFIVLGLLTRWVIAVQIPILVGAVLVSGGGQEGMLESLMALYALLSGLYLFIVGSGKHSVDYNLKLEV
mgnify:FL=1